MEGEQSPSFLAYEKVKAAKRAALNGEAKPTECPDDVWLILKEKYEARR